MIRRKASVVTQKPSRHADAVDPRQLSQVRALAADDRDLRLVDLLETEHVAAHPFTFPFGSVDFVVGASFGDDTLNRASGNSSTASVSLVRTRV